VRDEAAVLEDGEDFLRQHGKVILVTFVAYDAVLREDWSDLWLRSNKPKRQVPVIQEYRFDLTLTT